jgi:hypothetical protein
LGGIGLYHSSSSNNITGNTILNSGPTTCSVALYSSSNNKFYHNNFISASQQVFSSGSLNTWDNGYPSGGNYWSNLEGTDLYNGPYQNQTGFDWIRDTSYTIDANNTDHYPLTLQYSSDTGETEEAYRDLLIRCNTLQKETDTLNSTVDNLLNNNAGLEANVASLNLIVIGLQQQIAQLQLSISNLTLTFNSTLQSVINNQQEQNSKLSDQLNTTLNILYVLIATTAILTVSTIYFAAKKTKSRSPAWNQQAFV